ncbi:transposase [Dickeya dadantii subsp. dieffenbachiae]|uniref:transposase n=1 Tax=Dickeya dadantii TaxID=204038 RepID=UPI0008FF0469
MLSSMKSIDLVTIASLVAEAPEWGKLSLREISTFIAVTPTNRDSGKMHGRRTIFGGKPTWDNPVYDSTCSDTC